MRVSYQRHAIAAIAAGALAVPALVAAPADATSSQANGKKLERAVRLDPIVGHLRALQQIADVNNGTRVAGSGGHTASAGYVTGQLVAAGYEVRLQPFDFDYFQENSPAQFALVAPRQKSYVLDDDFATMQYSGSGDVTAAVTPVDLTLPPSPQPGSTSGCEASDFAGFPKGNVALIQRGTCTFGEKATNAANAGASAVVIFNEGQEGRTETLSGTLGEAVDIPVLGTSFAVGQELAQTAGARVHIKTDTTNQTRQTYNVIADLPGGRTNNTVMAGAHLDSVADGPGINDNGSGSAALLEVAVQAAKTLKKPKNHLRFAWWSAEEEGLLGSTHYTDHLSQAELGDIALYLNYDMVASPNYGYFVYDGDDSDKTGAGPGPEGSGAVERLFLDYYKSHKIKTEGTDFDGRSDYQGFIENGIPAGGIFTGAEGIKTKAQQRKWGGTAGRAYDPNYHGAGDTIRNINNTALRVNAGAMAYVEGVLAYDTSSVNGRKVAGKMGALKAQERPESTYRGHWALR